jgi:hypothetical protein
MAKEVTYLNPQLIKDWGILQEINRLLLHPRGLALALSVTTDENGVKKIVGIAGIQNYTGVRGGMRFDQALLSAPKKKKFDDLLKGNVAHRESKLGYIIQPIAPLAPAKSKPTK